MQGVFLAEYLGLLLRVAFKAKAIWDEFIEKVAFQVAGWKQMYLPKCDRIVD